MGEIAAEGLASVTADDSSESHKLEVLIWHCQDCSRHQRYTTHDEKKYEAFAERVSSRIEEVHNQVRVVTSQAEVAEILHKGIHSGEFDVNPSLCPFNEASPIVKHMGSNVPGQVDAGNATNPPVVFNSPPATPGLPRVPNCLCEMRQNELLFAPRLGCFEVYVKEEVEVKVPVFKPRPPSARRKPNSRPASPRPPGMVAWGGAGGGVRSDSPSSPSPNSPRPRRPMSARPSTQHNGTSPSTPRGVRRPRSASPTKKTSSPARIHDSDIVETKLVKRMQWTTLFSKLATNSWPSVEKVCTKFIQQFPPKWGWKANPKLDPAKDFTGATDDVIKSADSAWLEGTDGDEWVKVGKSIGLVFRPTTPDRLLDQLVDKVDELKHLVDKPPPTLNVDEATTRMQQMVLRACRVPFLIDLVERKGIVTTMEEYHRISHVDSTAAEFAMFVRTNWRILESKARTCAYRDGKKLGLPTVDDDTDTYRKLIQDAQSCVDKYDPMAGGVGADATAHRITHTLACNRFLAQLEGGASYGILEVMGQWRKPAEVLIQRLRKRSVYRWDKLVNNIELEKILEKVVGKSVNKMAELLEMIARDDGLRKEYVSVYVGNEYLGVSLEHREETLARLIPQMAKAMNVTEANIVPLSMMCVEEGDIPVYEMMFEVLLEESQVPAPQPSSPSSPRSPIMQLARRSASPPPMSPTDRLAHKWQSALALGDLGEVCGVRKAEHPPTYVILTLVTSPQLRKMSEAKFKRVLAADVQAAIGRIISVEHVNERRSTALLYVDSLETAERIYNTYTSKFSNASSEVVGSRIGAVWYCQGGDSGLHPGQWTNVKLFTSSTFSDMHNERNQLAQLVWPAIRRFCASRRVRFNAIDFRWGGVSAQDNKMDRGAVQCLLKMDECYLTRRVIPTKRCPTGIQKRPFAVSLLGSRRGWVPVYGEEPLCWECKRPFEDHKPEGCVCMITDRCERCNEAFRSHCRDMVQEPVRQTCMSCGHYTEHHRLCAHEVLLPKTRSACAVKDHSILGHRWNPGAERARSVAGVAYPWVLEGEYREHSITRLETDMCFFRCPEASEAHFFIRKMDPEALQVPFVPDFVRKAFVEAEEAATGDAMKLQDSVRKLAENRVTEYVPEVVDFDYEYKQIAERHLKELQDSSGADSSALAKARKAVNTLADEKQQLGVLNDAGLANVGGHGVRFGNLMRFGMMVGRSVVTSISRHHPELHPRYQLHSHIRERQAQQGCLEHYTKVFAGDTGDIQGVFQCAVSFQTPFVHVYGEPGGGKTTTAAKVLELVHSDPEYDTIFYFCGPWTRKGAVIEYLTRELMALSMGGMELISDWSYGPGEELEAFKAAANVYRDGEIQNVADRRVVIVVDGVQDDDTLHVLSQCALELCNVGKIVAFTSLDVGEKPPEVDGQVYYPLSETEGSARVEIAKEWLVQFGKDKSTDIAEIIGSNPGASSPQFIHMAAHEASQLSLFEFHDKVVKNYPKTVESMWQMEVLPRLSNFHCPEMVKTAVSILSSCPKGLLESELKRRLQWQLKKVIADADFEPLVESLRPFCVPTFGYGDDLLSLKFSLRQGTRMFLDNRDAVLNTKSSGKVKQVAFRAGCTKLASWLERVFQWYVIAKIKQLKPAVKWEVNPKEDTTNEYIGPADDQEEALKTDWLEHDDSNPDDPPLFAMRDCTSDRVIDNLLPNICGLHELVERSPEGAKADELRERLDGMIDRACRIPFLIDSIERRGVVAVVLDYGRIRGLSEKATEFSEFVLTRWRTLVGSGDPSETVNHLRNHAYPIGQEAGLECVENDVEQLRELLENASPLMALSPTLKTSIKAIKLLVPLEAYKNYGIGHTLEEEESAKLTKYVDTLKGLLNFSLCADRKDDEVEAELQEEILAADSPELQADKFTLLMEVLGRQSLYNKEYVTVSLKTTQLDPFESRGDVLASLQTEIGKILKISATEVTPLSYTKVEQGKYDVLVELYKDNFLSSSKASKTGPGEVVVRSCERFVKMGSLGDCLGGKEAEAPAHVVLMLVTTTQLREMKDFQVEKLLMERITSGMKKIRDGENIVYFGGQYLPPYLSCAMRL